MRRAARETAVGMEITRLLRSWLLLLLLGGIELASSYLPLTRPWRPLVILPGVLMAVVVAVSFMEIRKGPVIIRAFAVGSMFWLMVLLVLGSVDPLTRTNHAVPGTTQVNVPASAPAK